MTKTKFVLTDQDPATLALIGTTDHKTLGVWARDCAERVLFYFEQAYPHDPRPRQALDALQAWIDGDRFKMSVIRSASLGSHAAARAVGEDNPARSAARAAGQAVATAHVPRHSMGAAMYALQALYRASGADAEAVVATERAWQYQHLIELREQSVRAKS